MSLTRQTGLIKDLGKTKSESLDGASAQGLGINVTLNQPPNNDL